MFYLVIGPPAVGKSHVIRHFSDALFFPLQFVQVASSQQDPLVMKKVKKHRLDFAPDNWLIGSRTYARRQTSILENLYGGLDRPFPFDMVVAAKLAEWFKRYWASANRNILAEYEGEHTARWLEVLKPDRVICMCVSGALGIPYHEKRGERHPSDYWTPGKYADRQTSLLELLKGYVHESSDRPAP